MAPATAETGVRADPAHPPDGRSPAPRESPHHDRAYDPYRMTCPSPPVQRFAARLKDQQRGQLVAENCAEPDEGPNTVADYRVQQRREPAGCGTVRFRPSPG